MKIICLGTIILSTVMSLAQAPAGSSPKTTNPGAKPLSAETPVITLRGLCANKPATGACATTVTHVQFDRLVGMLSGGRDNPEKLAMQVKRQIATSYSDLLLLGVAGESAKLDKEPEAAETFRVARLRAFAELYRMKLQKQAQPSAAEVRKAYDEGGDKYRQLTLERVVVPVKRSGDLSEAAMKKVADDLRERAAKGAPFKELQTEAFDKAGMTGAPDTKLTVPADTVPADQQAILQLKPCEITPVLSSNGGFFFYQLMSQQQTPFEQVREQITNTMAQKKFQDEIENLRKQYPLDLNPAFFGETPPAAMMAPGGPGMASPPAPRPQSQPALPATK